MGVGYQATDRRVIDYDLWFAEGSNLAFRGPRGDLGAPGAICCAGAAQTFGRFVHRPYPQQLADLLGRSVLNLGFSGAGPEFFLTHDLLTDCLGRADITILQAMSARSVSAGLFEAQPNNGVLKFLEGPRKGELHLAQAAYQILRDEYGEAAFQAQIGAAQAQWLALYRSLAERIPGHRIFLWMSSRDPGDDPGLTHSPVGIFPHFVTADMLREIGDLGYAVVQATLKDMVPQVLVNDRTGLVEKVFDARTFPDRPERMRALNTYYATPGMHDLATRNLARHILLRDPG